MHSSYVPFRLIMLTFLFCTYYSHVMWPLPLLTLLTTYLSVLVIRMHHVTSFLLISYCTLVSTLQSISQLIPKPLTDPGHLIVLDLYI